MVALDADTGKLKWYFQFSPHDDFDYDSVQVPVLADMEWKGTMRRVMLWANRNGFYYVLDRTTGEFLQGKPFAKVTWTTGLDDSGHPVRVADAVPRAKGRWSIPASRARPTGIRLLTARIRGSFTFPHGRTIPRYSTSCRLNLWRGAATRRARHGRRFHRSRELK